MFSFVVWETILVHDFESIYLAVDGMIRRAINESRSCGTVFQQSACGSSVSIGP